MAIPRVKVVNPNESCRGTECYIDEKQIHGVRSVDFRVAVDEVPKFTFETLGLPEIDMSGETVSDKIIGFVTYSSSEVSFKIKVQKVKRNLIVKKPIQNFL